MNNLYLVIIKKHVIDSELVGFKRSQKIEKMLARYKELADNIKQCEP